MPRKIDRDEPDTVIFNLISLLTKRAMFGKNKYGTFLKTHNGRSALKDLLDELLDAAMYIEQLIMEIEDEDASHADNH